MATNLLYSFKIAGVEVLDYTLSNTKIELSRRNDSGNTAEIHLTKSVTDVVTPANGDEVIISRGVLSATEDYKFKGEIKRIETRADRYVITCKDKLNKLKYNLFSASYDRNIDSENGEFSAIFADIVEDGGFSTSVFSSGTDTGDITVDKFISKNQSRLNRCNLISRILNWFFYYDYNNDYVRLEPKGYTKYSTTLVVGTNIYNTLAWEQNIEPMRNKITVEGAFSVDTRNVTVVAGASQTEFDFEYTPESTECTVDGTLQKQGTLGSTETYDYTIDKENLTFTFVSALTGGESVVMNYQTRIPTPVIGESPSSQSKYNLTQHEIFKFKDVVTVADAETRVEQLLSILEDGEIGTSIFTDEYDLIPGTKVDVEDSNNIVFNGEYIIFKTTINYPGLYDVHEIGNERINISELFQTIEERLKLLEQDDFGLKDLLTILKLLVKTITLTRYSFDVEPNEKICDSYIVGHYINGIIGTCTVLEPFERLIDTNWIESGTFSNPTRESVEQIQGDACMATTTQGAGATTGGFVSTQSFGDLSQYTGKSSGAPSKGTVGLWLNFVPENEPTAVTLKIGSSSSDYAEVSALAYASVDGYDNWDNLIFTTQTGWNYFVFHLVGSSITGTPDWTDVDYVKIEFTFPALSGTLDLYIDYLTISESNYIGANGVGSRKMVIE